MAVEYRYFAVTIPAGTAIAAGFSASLAIPMRVVQQIDVRVPPGPRGEVGFGIGAAGNTIVPQGGQVFIVTDDQPLSFPLENTITSGAWVLYGYNTGLFPHTLYVTFHLQLVGAAPSGTSGTQLPPGSLDSGSGSSGGAPPGAPAPVPVPAPAPPPPPAPVPVPPPPGGGGNPVLILPPILPPGQSAPAPSTGSATILLQISSLAQVWLLNQNRYTQVTDNDTANALVGIGVPYADVSAAFHQQLLAATGQGQPANPATGG